jgi:ribosomal protein L22
MLFKNFRKIVKNMSDLSTLEDIIMIENAVDTKNVKIDFTSNEKLGMGYLNRISSLLEKHECDSNKFEFKYEGEGIPSYVKGKKELIRKFNYYLKCEMSDKAKEEIKKFLENSSCITSIS